MLVLRTALVLIIITNTVNSIDVYDVLKMTKNVIVDVIHAWEIFGPEGQDKPLPEPLRKKNAHLLNKIAHIQEQMGGMERDLMNTEALVTSLRKELPVEIKTILHLSKLNHIISEVERKDHLLKAYVASRGRSDESLNQFTLSIISHHPNSVLNLWDTLHWKYLAPKSDDHLTPIMDESFFTFIARIIKEQEEHFCSIPQSAQQMIFNVYNKLQIVQLKAYSLMQFSWMYRKTVNESQNYESEAKIIQDLFTKRLSEQAETIKTILATASQEFWRCDPKEHIPEVTYTQLTKFLQGFIINEVDMTKDETCREDCSFYKYTEQRGCYKDNYCSRQPKCRGNIVNCRFVDSDMWVCPSNNKGSNPRRYDWIKYENGRTMGEVSSTCSRSVNKVDSWWRWLFWHCSYCMCVCDGNEERDSHRYFSLKQVVTDTKNGRVLVGLRFVKKDKVIYIQAKEGELNDKGKIKRKTLKWVPIEPVNLSQDVEGIDYYKMSFQQRSLDLDTLLAPDNHVLTGLKWRQLGAHLNLELYACEYNYTTGDLAYEGQKCLWLSNFNTDTSNLNPRNKIVLSNPELPTKIRVPSKRDSRSNQYIEFTHSDLTSDVAQTALPLIDLQDVAPDPPTALIGAGIYHKKVYRSGGFIAPLVVTPNFADHITNGVQNEVPLS